MKQLITLCLLLISGIVFSQKTQKSFPESDGFSKKDSYVIFTVEDDNHPFWILQESRKAKQVTLYALNELLEVEQKYEIKGVKAIRSTEINGLTSLKKTSIFHAAKKDSILTLYLAYPDDLAKKLTYYEFARLDLEKLVVTRGEKLLKNTRGFSHVGIYPLRDKFVSVGINKANQLERIAYNTKSFSEKTQDIPFDIKLTSIMKSPKSALIQENERGTFMGNSSTSKFYKNNEDLMITVQGRTGTYLFMENEQGEFEKKFYETKTSNLSRINSFIYENKYLFNIEAAKKSLVIEVFDLATKESLLHKKITAENYKDFLVGEMKFRKSTFFEDKVYTSFEKFSSKVANLKPSILISGTKDKDVLQLRIGGYDDKVPAGAYIISAIGSGVGVATNGVVGFYGSGTAENEATMHVFLDMKTMEFKQDVSSIIKNPSKEYRNYLQVLERSNNQSIKNLGSFESKNHKYLYFYSKLEKAFIIKKF